MKHYDIAITGASGFVGAHAIRHFSRAGFSVLALGRGLYPPTGMAPYADYISADMEESVPAFRARVCIHAAGLADEKSSPQQLWKSNVEGTRQVFRAADAEHFIYISSASVYPPSGEIHFEDEAIIPEALSHYGQSKFWAEQYIQEQQASHRKLSIVRPRAIYGPGDRVLLPRILAMKKGPWYLQPGKLNFHISLTHINNLCQALEAMVRSEKKYPIEIFNVADTPRYQLDRVIDELMQACSPKKVSPIAIPNAFVHQLGRWFPKSNLNPELMRYFLCHHQIDNGKIQGYFDFQFQRYFEESVSELADWVQTQSWNSVRQADADLPWRVKEEISPEGMPLA